MKEAKHRQVHTVKFQFCQVLEQAKLIYGERNEKSAYLPLCPCQAGTGDFLGLWEYLACGGGYTGMYIGRNSLNCALKNWFILRFATYILQLKKKTYQECFYL